MPDQLKPITDPGATRADLLRRLFPNGPPKLWCPPLTHYTPEGGIDAARIRAHLRHLSPHVKGLLVPGTTGDGWELTPEETRQVLGLGLAQAAELGLHVLIGVLKPDEIEARASSLETVAWLETGTPQRGLSRPGSGVLTPPVCGFTFCPPRGSHLAQPDIGRALGSLLATGFPTALYQLPQVTQNEISPALAAELAARFGNFILFKDSSGADRVALSGQEPAGVFRLRGSEGGYARWLRIAGGAYDGFLLGSANCFAAELAQVIRELSAGHAEAATALSTRLSRIVGEAANLVTGLAQGNAFANANKALDHFFAFGPRAIAAPPPRLHAGSALPASMLRAAGELLARHGFMPAKGYLE